MILFSKVECGQLEVMMRFEPLFDVRSAICHHFRVDVGLGKHPLYHAEAEKDVPSVCDITLYCARRFESDTEPILLSASSL